VKRAAVAILLLYSAASPFASSDSGGGGCPFEDITYFNGLLGFSGQFRGIFDNAEYSPVRLAKPDQRTYFQTDFILYFDIRPNDDILIQIGPKLLYEFGNEESSGSLDYVRGSGPSAYLRVRAIYEKGGHHLSFGHFRDTQTPLTMEWEEVDDELAGVRWRWERGWYGHRFFLARTSTVADGQYETFASGGRAVFAPGDDLYRHYAANLATTHQGGFDTGGIEGQPPVGERKREVIVGSFSFDQPIYWGIYTAGEAAYSIGKSDVNDTVKDVGLWGEAGFRRAWFHGGFRIYRIGKHFQTPWGVDFLRNDEGIAYLADFVAVSGKASFHFELNDFTDLLFSTEFGQKWHRADFADKDYDFSNQLITFQVYL
jgi:hypothetical protein